MSGCHRLASAKSAVDGPFSRCETNIGNMQQKRKHTNHWEGTNMELMNLLMTFLFVGPYARYGGFKGCGILLHAQLSFWGPGKQLLETVGFPSLSLILHI